MGPLVSARASPGWRNPDSPLDPGLRLRAGGVVGRVIAGGQPTIVALHGLGASHRYWGRSLDCLAPSATVATVDLLGFGASAKPDGDYGIDQHLEALAAFLTSHAAEGPLVLIGHSFGSLLAGAAAHRWPDRVAGVIACSLPAYPSPDVARNHLSSLNPMAWLWLRAPRVAHIVCALTRGGGPLTRALAPLAAPGLPRPVARDGLLHTWDSYHGSLETLIHQASLRSWLAESPRTVVLQGSEDVTSPLVLLREALDGLAVPVRIVVGAGHNLPLERPDVVLRAVRAMVASVSAPGEPPRPEPGG